MFSKEFHDQAESEGWWMSQRDDGYWEIQKYDESNVFETDDMARGYVVARARTGSVMHQLALQLDGTKINPTR